MNRLDATLLICLAVAAGCGDDHSAPAASPGAAAKSDGHDHGDGHKDGDGHDHHEHDHDKGPKEMLGLVEVEGLEVSVVQNGKLTPGKDVSFDVEILGKSKPSAVRFWLGEESAAADAKRPPEHTKDNVHHVDLTAPTAIGVTMRLWVEIDRAGGAPVRASFQPKIESR